MIRPIACVGVVFALGASAALVGCAGAAPEAAPAGWRLVWQDDFDAPALDTARWQRETGGGGWGNAELEYYTDRPANARIEAGHLVIEARREQVGGREFTSARLKTRGGPHGAWQYGRIEARIQIPRGQGMWPAFWMLGDNCTRWPDCGEIDIMENIGREPRTVHGTVHGPGYSGAQGVTSAFTLTEPGRAFVNAFHVFAVEWEADAIRWYVDDSLYKTVTPRDLPGQWVFDHPFFIILNVAVGGNWPGNPDSTSVFPQTMRVDYVRVYERASAASGEVDVWTTHGLENVFRDARPPPDSPQAIGLVAARGETESAQIVIRVHERCVDSVRAEPSPLVDRRGRALGADAVRGDWVGYVHLTRNSDSTPAGELARRAPGDFPDPLLEDSLIRLCPDSTQPILVRVAVPRTAAPGRYEGTVTLRRGATVLRVVPLAIEILPVTLPGRPLLRVTNWFSAQAIVAQHHVDEWSDEHWRLLRAYAEDMHAHGQTMFQTDLDLVQVRRDSGGRAYTFDYSRFDRWVTLFLAAGLQHIELMHLGRRTEPWAWTNPFEASPRRADVPLEAFLRDLQRHLIDRGWIDRAVMHIADEPILENVESWRALSRRAHAAAPRLRRIEAIQVPDLDHDLEIWVVEESFLARWYDSTYRARQRGDGIELWLYTSWLPQGAYPNRLIDYPLLKTRLLPWAARRYDLSGFLHWGLNQWPSDVDPNKGLFAPGDDFIVYPGRHGPRSSLRWEAFRDGVEDYGLFTLWLRRDPRAARAALVEVVPSFTTYPRDPAVLVAVRERALRALAGK